MIKQRIRADNNETLYTKHQIAKFAKRAKSAASIGKNDKVVHELKHLAKAQSRRASARNEARITHVAHMFIKNTPLNAAEDPNLVKEVFNFYAVQSRVAELTKLKTPEFSQGLSQWADGWFEIARAKIKERQLKCNTSV